LKKQKLILYLYGTLESRHGLLYLCKKVSEKNKAFLEYLDGCAFVNEYYIETRYPNENPLVVSTEDAQKCMDIAEKILNKVLSCI